MWLSIFLEVHFFRLILDYVINFYYQHTPVLPHASTPISPFLFVSKTNPQSHFHRTMNEQNDGVARLETALRRYIRPRQEISHIRRVFALHLREAHPSEAEKEDASRPLPLQECNGHVKSSVSHGLRQEYLKSLRANSKARKQYESISSEHRGEIQTVTVEKSSKKVTEDPLQSYTMLLKQQRKLERLRVLVGYLDILDRKPAASQHFLDPKVITKDMDPLPPVPSTVLNDGRMADKGSAKSVTELIHQLEKAVLQAKFGLDVEKRQRSEFHARLSTLDQSPGTANSRQRLDALARTRNEMISWMEDQLGRTGDDSPHDDTDEIKLLQITTSAESQLIRFKKEYRKYVLTRQEFLSVLKSQAQGVEPPRSHDTIEKSQNPQDPPEVPQRTEILHPYLTELLSISNEQKSQILQRSHLNMSLAKQVKGNMLSLDRLAEESHLLPTYPMKASTKGLRTLRLVGRADLASGTLVGAERPDFVARARRWVFAADAAGHATKDAVMEKVDEGRAAVDESLETLLGLHQLLGYDLDDAGENANEDDIWAPKSAKKRSELAGKDDEGPEQSRRDIWSTIDGSLGAIRREKE